MGCPCCPLQNFKVRAYFSKSPFFLHKYSITTSVPIYKSCVPIYDFLRYDLVIFFAVYLPSGSQCYLVSMPGHKLFPPGNKLFPCQHLKMVSSYRNLICSLAVFTQGSQLGKNVNSVRCFESHEWWKLTIPRSRFFPRASLSYPTAT